MYFRGWLAFVFDEKKYEGRATFSIIALAFCCSLALYKCLLIRDNIPLVHCKTNKKMICEPKFKINRDTSSLKNFFQQSPDAMPQFLVKHNFLLVWPFSENCVITIGKPIMVAV